MRKRWKLWLAIAVGVPVVGFALAMLNPFFRQLVFGPKYNGIPLVSWQQFLKNPPVPTLGGDSARGAIMTPPGPTAWQELSPMDRQTILLSLAGDREDIVRSHVADHLAEASGIPEVVDLLKHYTADRSSRVRQHAAQSLGKISPPAVDSLPELLRMLVDPDPQAADAATIALANLGSRAPEKVVQGLIPLIEGGDMKNRLGAITALGKIKSGTELAVPPLVKALEDKHPHVRASAVSVLATIQAKETIPNIIVAMRDPYIEVENAATYAIAKFGPLGQPALPRLIEQVKALGKLDSPLFPYRVDPPVLVALGSIGEPAREAIPELLKLRKHKSHQVRKSVEMTLSRIDPAQFPPKMKAAN